ncbi:MAG TPA: response regulator transcription factor [Pyrinomonadaceae bacterium]|nr:response regulator transcription factor [Pyrinomonadaceae bacterium]
MTTSTPTIKVLIVDDHAVVRAGLRMLIDQDPDMKVTGLAGNRSEALAAATSEQPHIIILDIVLGDDDGLSFLPELRAVAGNARVLVLTGLRSPESQRRAMRAGAMGIVLKEHAAEVLIKAIKKVHQGEVWLDRLAMGSVLQEISENKQPEPDREKIASLTEREREVIGLVGEGLKNKQIASRLFISETTVTHHLSSVFSKLEVSDRLELIIYAFRHGLAKMPGQTHWN